MKDTHKPRREAPGAWPGLYHEYSVERLELQCLPVTDVRLRAERRLRSVSTSSAGLCQQSWTHHSAGPVSVNTQTSPALVSLDTDLVLPLLLCPQVTL